jgi:hypothetical protein
MVYKIYLIGFTSFCLFIGCRATHEIPYLELSAVRQAAYNEHFQEGEQAGKIKGEKIGYQVGFEAGEKQSQVNYEIGLHDGYLKAYETANESIKKDRNSDLVPNHIAKVYLESAKYAGEGGAKPFLDTMLNRQMRFAARKFDTMPYYQHGFNAGWGSYAKGHLKVQLSHLVEVNPQIEYDFPKAQYDFIFNELKKIHELQLASNPYPHEPRKIFSNMLKRIHLDILDYLGRKLSLTALDNELLKNEYLKAHDDMVGTYYTNFRNIINHETIETKHKGFYDLMTYYYGDAFIRVVRDGICGVADVMFTFVKKNSLYAGVNGLDNIGEGHICQVVMEKVVSPLKLHIDRITLGYDYDVAIPTIEATLKTHFSNLVLETREVLYPELIEQSVQLKDGTTTHITLQLYAYVGLSVNPDFIGITHSLSDAASFLSAKISDKPFVLPHVFHVGYKVVNTDVTAAFEYETPRYSIFGKLFFWKKSKFPKKQIVKQKKTIDMSKEYENIFNQHKYKVTYDFISAIVQKQDLNTNCMNIFLPIVEKIFEPLLSVPTSHYVVRMAFGSQQKEILRTF